MKKWYKQAYFNRRNWILENFDILNLTCEETILMLLIDYSKEANIELTIEYLEKKLKKDSKQIDEIIARLVAKNYLKIEANENGICFDIDSLFDEDLAKLEDIDNKDTYDIVETFLARPLTASEMMKVNDLIENFGENKLIDAIRLAEAYRKNSLNYVEGILNNENK